MASVNDAVLPPPPIVLTLAGRTFRRPESTTVQQDAYVMKRQMGFATWKGEPTSPMLAGQGIIMDAFESGLMYEILAGVLVEDGVKWTPAVAAENAAFFAELTERADKNALWENVAGILADFLVGAAEWSNAFQKSSRDGAARPVEAPALDPAAIIAELNNSTTENGTSSSENSLVTT